LASQGQGWPARRQQFEQIDFVAYRRFLALRASTAVLIEDGGWRATWLVRCVSALSPFLNDGLGQKMLFLTLGADMARPTSPRGKTSTAKTRKAFP
jgi:hypothetical protein